MDDNVHSGHRERLRKQYEVSGLDGFSDHNVLEYILFAAIPYKDTNLIAHKLIKRFGSLAGVLEAPVSELILIDGIKTIAALHIKSYLDVSRRYQIDKSGKDTILNSTEKAGNYIKTAFHGIADERTYLTTLDAKKKMINHTLICEGTVNATNVNMRKIMHIALASNAVAVILSHNHPSGLALPSIEDMKTTIKVKKLLLEMGITLEDHIIVVDDDYISFAQSNLLDEQHVMSKIKAAEEPYKNSILT